VPIGPGGAVTSGAATPIELGGEWEQVDNSFNANGIEATSDGRWLIVVNSTTGKLYRVDPQTGTAKEIDLGGARVLEGDGVRLVGKTLYVVQPDKIAVVRLDPGFASGAIVREITSPLFRWPTTADVFGSRLYAVNAAFDEADPNQGPCNCDVKFEIVGVSRR
jgi:sugar lactone lactonase YvrE